MKRRPLAILIGLVLSGAVFAANAQTTQPLATPPAQPASGPGGSEAPFADFVMHRYGDGDTQYWIFEPAKPTPSHAPVIIFCHGWSALTPNIYGAWIKHIARRGNIVIIPRYQATIHTRMRYFTPNAISAVKAALAELQTGGHVKPELDHVAIVGHSMGGAMAMNLAAEAAAEGLPVPRAICCVEPDNVLRSVNNAQMPLADLSTISPDTLVQVVVGIDDRLAGDETAKTIYAQLSQIPAAKKDFITLVSDYHGQPALKANHLAPVAWETVDPEPDPAIVNDPKHQAVRQWMVENSVDAMDFFGTWKLFDGLTDAAFYGKNLQYALGNTAEQRFMGRWSDGTAVEELRVGEAP
jgi:dienelactone hydrolase